MPGEEGQATLMKILAAFEQEHELIERVAGALFRWADREGAEADAQRFVSFFSVYSSGFHHRREEEILMPALVRHLEVPADRGPLRVVRGEHGRLEVLASRLAAAADRDTARELARTLWEHIDKEDSVLFPEAGERLPRASVAELPDRTMTAEERAARDLGERLVEQYPPLEDPEMIRGAGCIACSAFTVTCRGIEAEWWNAWEWEQHGRADAD
jgi:hemerythrin-like domain-containing protein